MSENSENEGGYFELEYKILFLGESSVDKTGLIKRYTKKEFGALRIIGIYYQQKIIDIENKKIKLRMWDNVGQERFRNIENYYYKSCHGLVLVYDITDKGSFETINFWLAKIKLDGPKNIKLMLVGNKCELSNERKVSIEEGENLAKEYDIPFFEVSSKEGTNVNELFFHLANEIYQDDKLKGKDNKEKKLKESIKLIKYINF